MSEIIVSIVNRNTREEIGVLKVRGIPFSIEIGVFLKEKKAKSEWKIERDLSETGHHAGYVD